MSFPLRIDIFGCNSVPSSVISSHHTDPVRLNQALKVQGTLLTERMSSVLALRRQTTIPTYIATIHSAG
jgi:hypothetical protein